MLNEAEKKANQIKVSKDKNWKGIKEKAQSRRRVSPPKPNGLQTVDTLPKKVHRYRERVVI